jgi:hypothetical protein
MQGGGLSLRSARPRALSTRPANCGTSPPLSLFQSAKIRSWEALKRAMRWKRCVLSA